MTVTTTENSIEYAGNDTTTAFAFPYIFFAPANLVVSLIENDVAITPAPVLNGAGTYDYTVTGTFENGEYASGGTVTFNTAPITGYTVRFVRIVPALQTVTLIDNTKFPAETINTEFDYLTVLAQQSGVVAANIAGTALRIPDSEIGLIVQAAHVALRANKILAWDASGNLIHSVKNLSDYDDVDTAHFDLRYVLKTGDSMSGALFAPFMTTNNMNVNTSFEVLTGGTAKAPTVGQNDVSINLATTAWVVGLLGAQGQGEAVWKFGDSTVSGDPGNGFMDIQIGAGVTRTISMSKLDADGVSRFLTAMQAGDAMVVTNELTPVVAYARYTLISDLTDNGAWVQFDVHMNDSSNPLEAPPHNTRLRVTGFLNTMNGGAAIDGVSAGYGLTGGGSSGVIPIAVDPTVIAPIASPLFTGDPRLTTQPPLADNDTSLVNSKWVKDQAYASAATLANYLPLAGGTLTGPLAGTTAAFSGAVTVSSLNATAGVRAFSTTAPPTGGTLGTGVTMSNIVDFGLMFGAGVPDKAAPKGALYLRSDGTGTPYYNSDGTGAGWLQVGSGGGAAVHVGTSPPSSPTAGQLWWYSDASTGGGTMYIYYNDTFGSPQWVPTSPQVGANTVLQTVSTQTGAMATGTTIIPADDTIPQITEGTEFMTLAITPKSATSKLIIDVTFNGAISIGGPSILGVALFQDATANALAGGLIHTVAANCSSNIKFTHTMTSGTASATTFRVRAGAAAAATTTFNGDSGARRWGGVMASSIVIQEVV